MTDRPNPKSATPRVNEFPDEKKNCAFPVERYMSFYLACGEEVVLKRCDLPCGINPARSGYSFYSQHHVLRKLCLLSAHVLHRKIVFSFVVIIHWWSESCSWHLASSNPSKFGTPELYFTGCCMDLPEVVLFITENPFHIHITGSDLFSLAYGIVPIYCACCARY